MPTKVRPRRAVHRRQPKWAPAAPERVAFLVAEVRAAAKEMGKVVQAEVAVVLADPAARVVLVVRVARQR